MIDWALLALRAVVGGLFLLHGLDKFANTGPFEGWLKHLGIKHYKIAAGLAAHSEFWGGLALVLGWGTGIASVLLIAVMLGAIKLAHWQREPFVSAGGWEYCSTLIAVNVLLLAFGPGHLSLSALLG